MHKIKLKKKFLFYILCYKINMRETTLEIPGFNTLIIRVDDDEYDETYIMLCITLLNIDTNFKDYKSPFLKISQNYIVPFTENYNKIKFRFRRNDKIDKDLEYLFMPIDKLSQFSGTITPLRYKIKIIEAFSLFDD